MEFSSRRNDSSLLDFPVQASEPRLRLATLSLLFAVMGTPKKEREPDLFVNKTLTFKGGLSLYVDKVLGAGEDGVVLLVRNKSSFLNEDKAPRQYALKISLPFLEFKTEHIQVLAADRELSRKYAHEVELWRRNMREVAALKQIQELRKEDKTLFENLNIPKISRASFIRDTKERNAKKICLILMEHIPEVVSLKTISEVQGAWAANPKAVTRFLDCFGKLASGVSSLLSHQIYHIDIHSRQVLVPNSLFQHNSVTADASRHLVPTLVDFQRSVAMKFYSRQWGVDGNGRGFALDPFEGQNYESVESAEQTFNNIVLERYKTGIVHPVVNTLLQIQASNSHDTRGFRWITDLASECDKYKERPLCLAGLSVGIKKLATKVGGSSTY